LLHRSWKSLGVLPPLLGSAILVACAIASLPPGFDWLRRPRTPYDRSQASMVAPGYALLSAAARVIPAGASVVVKTEPPDAVQETWYHRIAVALLPGRRPRPAAFYGQALSPDLWRDSEYLVLVGARPATPPGEPVLETADGTVWRLRKR
jgi:hypothetical protein